MTSHDGVMGESSSGPLSQDDDGRTGDDDSDDSSSISSVDSIESDLDSESFTDVTPLHSISNSPLPTQSIGQAAKLRDSVGGTDEDNSDHDSSDDDDDDDDNDVRREELNGKIFAKNGRRPTVKRAPSRQPTQNTTDSDVSNLSEAIQKIDIQQGVRSRRIRDHEKRLENENEHLLKRIIAQKSRVAEYVVSNPPRSHVASSSINRKRHQKFIHAQNLALHKRIEAARNGSPVNVVGVFNSATSTTNATTAPSRNLSQPNATGPQQRSRQRHDTR